MDGQTDRLMHGWKKDEYTDRRGDGNMDRWIDGWIDGWKMEECMDKRIGGYMDGEADE